MTTATRSSRQEALARLGSAQKSNRGAGGYSRWINRPFGRQIAAIAYLSGRTPNQISAISATLSFAAIAAIAVIRPSWPLAVLATAALVLGYAFDSADGQVARLRGGGSAAGEWLDHVLDAIKISSFHLAVAICWFRFYDLRHAAWLLVPLAFTVVAAVFFFAIVLSDMLRRVQRVKAGENGVTTASVNPGERAPILRSLVVLPGDYGVLALSVLLLAAQSAFMTVYTVLFAANALFLAAGCVRWFREMRALSQ